MHFVLHTFRPTETIDAVIRLKGRHDFTREEVVAMRKRFNDLNGPVVPRAGDVFKIPLPQLTTDDFGELVDVTPPEVEVETSPSCDREDPADDQEAAAPSEPVHDVPVPEQAGDAPSNASQKNRNEQVTPHAGKDPSDCVEKPAKQGPVLTVGGRRRT